MRMHNPAHPGRILGHYLTGRSVTDVARHLRITRPTLSRLLNGKAGVSAEMALRLAEAFATEPDFWLRLQLQYDLAVAQKRRRARIKPLPAIAA